MLPDIVDQSGGYGKRGICSQVAGLIINGQQSIINDQRAAGGEGSGWRAGMLISF
jgi:hypothetical protein